MCDGYPLSESQEITLRNGLGERADGSWAATRIADFGPRQGTGKNDKITARELAGLFLFGEELLLHTAHEFPTANESFLRLVAVLENWDDLRRKVARIRYANGEQGVELLSGQRLKYRARTGGSGRGFAKADLVVYDESQHLSREHVAASGPAKLANPNSQTYYAGSGGLPTSSVAAEIRRAAIAGTGGRLAYTEMTAEFRRNETGLLVPAEFDPLDRKVWYDCIPGLGRWVTEEGVMALYDELGVELFVREILCVWDPDVGAEQSIIPLNKWDALKDESHPITSGETFALDVSPDRQRASFAVAGRCADSRVQVEVFDARPGTSWIVERAVKLHQDHGKPIRIEKGGPAGSFVSLLTEAGVKVEEVSSADHARATGQFIDAVSSSTLRHRGDTVLRAAIVGATLRHTGDASLFSRRSSKVDITPLVASVLALGGVPEPSGPEFFVY